MISISVCIGSSITAWLIAPQALGGAHDPPRVSEAVSQVEIEHPLQMLMTSWGKTITRLHVFVHSIGGQANDDQQQHVTQMTPDVTLHVNSADSHTGQHCAQNYSKKTAVTSAW